MNLTKEEQDILKAVENGEWESVDQLHEATAQYQTAAKNTMKKDKRVNIRMTERDLIHFQKAAMHEGLPYQTLISSVLHKYINGRLVDKVG
jgi:predicted DNA binding CopG/RHH family protein